MGMKPVPSEYGSQNRMGPMRTTTLLRHPKQPMEIPLQHGGQVLHAHTTQLRHGWRLCNKVTYIYNMGHADKLPKKFGGRWQLKETHLV
jgi:hypothetical protein